MRVLLLTTRFPAVSETFVVRHALGVQRRGVEVWVLAVTGELGLLAENDPDTRLLRSRSLGLTEVGLGVANLIHAITALPVGFGSLRLLADTFRDIAVKRTGLGNRRTLVMPRALLDAPQFDLIHAQHGQMALSAARLIEAGFLRGPLVATFHGSDLNTRRRRSTAFLYKPVWRRAALCTTGTSHMAEHLIQAGVDEHRRLIMPMGVDIKEYQPAESAFALPPHRLACVGRLVTCKSTETAIRAVAKIRRGGGDVRLDIVGDGPLRSTLEGLAESLGVKEQVFFHGSLPAPAARKVMADCHIFVHPGVVDEETGQREGQGVVLAEAQAMGKPVVASRVGGIPDVVREGETALLTPPGDADSTAESIQRLIDDPSLAKRFAAAGPKLIAERFNQEKIMDRWVTIYEELISRYRD